MANGVYVAALEFLDADGLTLGSAEGTQDNPITAMAVDETTARAASIVATLAAYGMTLDDPTVYITAENVDWSRSMSATGDTGEYALLLDPSGADAVMYDEASLTVDIIAVDGESTYTCGPIAITRDIPEPPAPSIVMTGLKFTQNGPQISFSDVEDGAALTGTRSGSLTGLYWTFPYDYRPKSVAAYENIGTAEITTASATHTYDIMKTSDNQYMNYLAAATAPGVDDGATVVATWEDHDGITQTFTFSYTFTT